MVKERIGITYTDDRQKAIEFAQKLAGEDSEVFPINTNFPPIGFTTETVDYIVVKVSPYLKGFYFDKVYVDPKVQINHFYQFVKPTVGLCADQTDTVEIIYDWIGGC